MWVREEARIRRWSALVGISAATLIGAACGDSATTVPPVFMEPGGVTAFYEWTEPVPHEPGRLLRSEPLEAEFGLENATRAIRVLYSSESWTGDPTVVSGAVFLPEGNAPEGGWPILAWSHGTVGIADKCAPSARPRGSRDRRYLNHWLAEGYAIVATDYEGLGTGGTHPYVHARSEAYGNVDMVRAARELLPALSDAWLVLGQSQGGQGALATGALAEQRAPELDFRGTLSTAPAVNLLDLFAGAGTGGQQGAQLDDPMPALGFVVLLVTAMDLYTPTFSALEALEPKARALLPFVHEECSGDLIQRGLSPLLTVRESFSTWPFGDTPGVADAVERMDIPESDAWNGQPVLIGQGTEDTLLPYTLTGQFAEELCGLGADLTLIYYERGDHSSAVNHGLPELTPWVAARFAGEPIDGCREFTVPVPAE